MVSLTVLEAEMGLEPTAIRLERKVTTHALRVLVAGKDNPAQLITTKKWDCKRFATPLGAAIQAQPTLRTWQTNPITQLPPIVRAPWRCLDDIAIIEDETQARLDVIHCSHRTQWGQGAFLYTDASQTATGTGIGVACEAEDITSDIAAVYIGNQETCTILAAEIIALEYALEYTLERTLGGNQWQRIYTDSQGLIRALQQGWATADARPALARVWALLHRARRCNPSLQVRWIPAHKGILGNERADELAKRAATTALSFNRTIHSGIQITRHQQGMQDNIDKERQARTTETAKNRPTAGQHTWKLDQALPYPHMRRVYNLLNAEEANILMQARSGHDNLNAYKHRLRLIDDPQCECGRGYETTSHILLRCTRSDEQRKTLGSDEKTPVRGAAYEPTKRRRRRCRDLVVAVELRSSPRQ
jgi:ribonuclease HI